MVISVSVTSAVKETLITSNALFTEVVFTSLLYDFCGIKSWLWESNPLSKSENSILSTSAYGLAGCLCQPFHLSAP